jgi:phage tail-like protein
MAEFTVNAQRFNPYKNFKFQLKWDGIYVAGISKCSALIRTTQVVKHRDGADPSTPRLSPGQSEFKPITLERGVTYDLAFEAWANKVWQVNASLGAEVSLKDFRKNVRLEFYNEAGQLAIAYTIQNAWVSEYQALPELDASGNAVAIQRIVLENEGWVRDTSTIEQPEISYNSTAA